MQLLKKSPFSCHAVLAWLHSQSFTVKGKKAAANFESGGAKPAPPGSPSHKKFAAAFRKAPPLLGRCGYEFYCRCKVSDKKSPRRNQPAGAINMN